MKDQHLDEQAQFLLQRARAADSVVLCVGAGASINAGAPSWRSLAMTSLNRFGQMATDEAEQFLANSGPDEVFDLLEARMGRHRLVRMLEEALEPGLKTSALHDAMASIPRATFVTTNFDVMLEQAIASSGREAATVITDEDLSEIDRDVVPVVKLHGSLHKPSSLALSMRDRRRLDSHRSHLSAYLRTLLASRLVLFVGFSLQGSSFRELFESYRGSTEEPADWVVLGPQPNALAKSVWEARGIRFVVLDIGDIPEFLRTLTRHLGRRGTSLPSGKRGNRLFISHGRSDRLSGIIKDIALAQGLVVAAWEDMPLSGETVYERLDREVERSSAAVVVLASDEGDDRTGVRFRSNQVFELGYLVGKLGKERVLVVVPRGTERLPTDLAGMHFIQVDPARPRLMTEALGNWLHQVIG